jgi:Uma2 family endonuclease
VPDLAKKRYDFARIDTRDSYTMTFEEFLAWHPENGRRVVSQNWRDDYDYKFSDYEAMGIQEYWLVDFRALAAARAIGQPKQPTITLCTLVEEGYELKRYHTGDMLKSFVLPELQLSVDEVFAAAQ